MLEGADLKSLLSLLNVKLFPEHLWNEMSSELHSRCLWIQLFWNGNVMKISLWEIYSGRNFHAGSQLSLIFKSFKRFKNNKSHSFCHGSRNRIWENGLFDFEVEKISPAYTMTHLCSSLPTDSSRFLGTQFSWHQGLARLGCRQRHAYGDQMADHQVTRPLLSWGVLRMVWLLNHGPLSFHSSELEKCKASVLLF